MPRISLDNYLKQCEDTDRFDGGYALELVIREIPADPEHYDPVEILSRMEEEVGIPIAKLKRRLQCERDIDQLIARLKEVGDLSLSVANNLKSLKQGN